MPLVGVGADEAVEVFEAKTGRPQIERARLTGLLVGNIMVLAEPRSCYARFVARPQRSSRCSWASVGNESAGSQETGEKSRYPSARRPMSHRGGARILSPGPIRSFRVLTPTVGTESIAARR